MPDLVHPDTMRTPTLELSWLLTASRERAGLSQHAAAKKLGVSAWKLREMEMGYENELSNQLADLICKTYEISSETLVATGVSIKTSVIRER